MHIAAMRTEIDILVLQNQYLKVDQPKTEKDEVETEFELINL